MKSALTIFFSVTIFNYGITQQVNVSVSQEFDIKLDYGIQTIKAGDHFITLNPIGSTYHLTESRIDIDPYRLLIPLQKIKLVGGIASNVKWAEINIITR